MLANDDGRGVLGFPTITDNAERPTLVHYGSLLEISAKIIFENWLRSVKN